MKRISTFQRRGIVEGFFGPPWSMAHRKAIFEFGVRRGMNTYLYAPKDDPYHRERWTEPYPEREWKELLRLIRSARDRGIDFVYGFHPGKGLCFSAEEPVRRLLAKAGRFYDAGVRSFAILFDDIPARLDQPQDRKAFGSSLARAEGAWLGKVTALQPAAWNNVEWWICPSYYTEDPLLARIFGPFEPLFLETLVEHLPRSVACFWTGPKVVCKKIGLAHARKIARLLKHRLILWDNYPVNDLSMKKEMHLSPLSGRDPRLPEEVYGYLNNPLLQESLSFIPLATCFDYAANPARYDPEKSWTRMIKKRFGAAAVPHWQAIRRFCERSNGRKDGKRPVSFSRRKISALSDALNYVAKHRREKWAEELRPWMDQLRETLTEGGVQE
jgi:hyaluronoglucosaminidase